MHVDSPFEPESTEDNELMKAVARVLRRNSRASDILARVEYDKFSVLMPETRTQDADAASQRFRTQVLEYLAGMGEHYADVNIELGIASYPEQGEEGAVLLQEATESILREGMEGR